MAMTRWEDGAWPRVKAYFGQVWNAVTTGNADPRHPDFKNWGTSLIARKLSMTPSTANEAYMVLCYQAEGDLAYQRSVLVNTIYAENPMLHTVRDRDEKEIQNTVAATCSSYLDQINRNILSDARSRLTNYVVQRSMVDLIEVVLKDEIQPAVEELKTFISQASKEFSEKKLQNTLDRLATQVLAVYKPDLIHVSAAELAHNLREIIFLPDGVLRVIAGYYEDYQDSFEPALRKLVQHRHHSTDPYPSMPFHICPTLEHHAIRMIEDIEQPPMTSILKATTSLPGPLTKLVAEYYENQPKKLTTKYRVKVANLKDYQQADHWNELVRFFLDETNENALAVKKLQFAREVEVATRQDVINFIKRYLTPWFECKRTGETCSTEFICPDTFFGQKKYSQAPKSPRPSVVRTEVDMKGHTPPSSPNVVSRENSHNSTPPTSHSPAKKRENLFKLANESKHDQTNRDSVVVDIDIPRTPQEGFAEQKSPKNLPPSPANQPKKDSMYPMPTDANIKDNNWIYWGVKMLDTIPAVVGEGCCKVFNLLGNSCPANFVKVPLGLTCMAPSVATTTVLRGLPVTVYKTGVAIGNCPGWMSAKLNCSNETAVEVLVSKPQRMDHSPVTRYSDLQSRSGNSSPLNNSPSGHRRSMLPALPDAPGASSQAMITAELKKSPPKDRKKSHLTLPNQPVSPDDHTGVTTVPLTISVSLNNELHENGKGHRRTGMRFSS
jgi:hypothetical protein